MNDRSQQTLVKLRGGYYTPDTVSEVLTNWMLKDQTQKVNILEPSAGDGSMIRPLLKSSLNIDVTAIELDSAESKKLELLTKEDNRFDIQNIDFFEFYEKNKMKFDSIIGNPPYIRYQFLTPEQREIQSDILKKNGMKSNKLINAWVAFTVACVEMLKNGGKIAFVLPNDILQVSYAEGLRKFLFEQLSEMTITTFEKGIFEGIQQDVLLLQGIKREEKNREESHKIRIINLPDINNLSVDYMQPFSNLTGNDDKKWTKYLLPYSDIEHINNLYSSKIAFPFSKFGKVEVGITTGKNELFTVPQETIDKYNLSQYALPLLGRSVQANGVFYTQEDLSFNIEQQKKVWLLDFNGKTYSELSSGAKEYIKNIESLGLNNGYKLRIRNEWYKVPSIWSPDAFMLRRIGSSPKIILNDINAVSTDTFHRIKFFGGTDRSWTIFGIYSSIGLLSFELAGRNFGGGALEILPGDINEILVPNKPNYVSNEKSKELLKTLDNKFRSGDKIEDIINYVDQTFIELNIINKDDATLYQSIWKKLNARRASK